MNNAVVEIFSIACYAVLTVSPKGTDFAKQLHLQYATNSTVPIEHNAERVLIDGSDKAF